MAKKALVGAAMMFMAAMAGWGKYLRGLFSGKKMTTAKSPWERPKRIVDRFPIWPYACYNKSIMRMCDRAKKKTIVPATPTSTTMKCENGKSYRIFSDGSYRLMKAIKGKKIIPV